MKLITQLSRVNELTKINAVARDSSAYSFRLSCEDVWPTAKFYMSFRDRLSPVYDYRKADTQFPRRLVLPVCKTSLYYKHEEAKIEVFEHSNFPLFLIIFTIFYFGINDTSENLK